MAVSITQKTADRLLIGRTIVASRVETMDTGRGDKAHHIHWLKLDNGAVVSISVRETEFEPVAEATYRKAGG